MVVVSGCGVGPADVSRARNHAEWPAGSGGQSALEYGRDYSGDYDLSGLVCCIYKGFICSSPAGLRTVAYTSLFFKTQLEIGWH